MYSCQITAFALGPGVHEILCVTFKSEVSITPSPVGLLQLSPTDLQSRMLWGLVFTVLDPWAGGPDMGLRILIPVGEPLQYSYSPVFGLPTWRVWDLTMSRVHPSHPSHYVFSCRRSFL